MPDPRQTWPRALAAKANESRRAFVLGPPARARCPSHGNRSTEGRNRVVSNLPEQVAARHLLAQATGQSSFPLEATAKDKFEFDQAGVVIEFNIEKNEMNLKQGGGSYLFTKDK